MLLRQRPPYKAERPWKRHGSDRLRSPVREEEFVVPLRRQRVPALGTGYGTSLSGDIANPLIAT